VGGLVKCGLSEKEAAETLGQARDLCQERVLKESGVPAVSLKKYQEAGVADPEAFCNLPAPYLSQKTGIKLDTVYKHAEKVCQHLRREPPKKISQAVFDRGRAELLALPNLGEATLERLFRAGVTDAASFAEADPVVLAERSGIPPAKLREYRAALAGHARSTARNLAREAASR
jgi:DNA topoisomerase-1